MSEEDIKQAKTAKSSESVSAASHDLADAPVVGKSEQRADHSTPSAPTNVSQAVLSAAPDESVEAAKAQKAEKEAHTPNHDQEDDSGLVMVMNRNHFYRDNFRKLSGLLVVAFIANILLVLSALYVYTHRPEPQYFATDQSGRITKLHPLSEPVFSTSAVLQWANEAAVSAYTYNFVNYRKQLQKASDYFTPEGWKNFEAALQSSNNLKSVIQKKLVVSAVATGAPIIQQRGIISDRYAWKLQLPILVTYQSSSSQFQQALTITMIVTRVPVLNDPKGIAISQFIASAR